MCDQAPVCACKVRIASLGAAAVGTMVAAVAVFAVEHLVFLAVVLVLAAAGAVGLAWAARRSARLAVAYWPAMEQRRRVALAARPVRVLPAAVPRALPAAQPVMQGVVIDRAAVGKQ